MSKRARRRKRRLQASAQPRHCQFDAPISFSDVRAESGAEGGDAPALRRFEVLAYTGTTMDVGWGAPVIIDLAGLRTRQAIPILQHHDRRRIVGHSDSVVVDRDVRITGVVSGTSEAAREVTETSRNGFPWQASVGVSATKIERVKPGDSATANGKTVRGPVYVIRGGDLNETSFVPMGADRDTSGRLAAQEHTMTFEQWLAARGFDAAALTEAQTTTLRAAYQAEIEAQDDDDDDATGTGEDANANANANRGRGTGNGGNDDANSESPAARMRAEAAAEVDRQTEIRRIAADHPRIMAQAIRENWDVTRTELAVVRADRPAAPMVGTGDNGTANAQAVEAALLLSHGVNASFVGQHYDERAMNAASGRDLRNIGLQWVMAQVCATAGVHMPRGGFGNDHIRAALTAEDRLARTVEAQTFSTYSLAGILGNVANKVGLAAFLAVEPIAQRICASTSTKDFKAFRSWRLTATGEFTEVGPDGELKHISLTEEGFDNQLKTRGAIVALTRQHMYNDDLGAFLSIARHLARLSGISLQRAFHLVWLANPGSPAFFSTDHGNYIEGGDTNLGIDGLSQLEQKFADQVDQNGNPIMVAPQLLFAPTSLKTIAGSIYTDAFVNETTTANKAKPAGNPHKGKYEPVISPWLNAQALPGSSATAWHLVANPNDVPAAEIAYLNGQQTPTIEGGETSFNTLGMQWRGFFDFGVALKDYRGAAKSKGAA